MPKSQFPKDFLWGASTASHQVEGGTYNQWSMWEATSAKRLAHTAAKRLRWLPHWGKVKPAAQDPHNYLSGKGVEHYTRYKADFKLLTKMNLTAFRFGIEWSRIEPQEGQWDQAALAHYTDYLKALRAEGIEPVLNLWHWTVPVWFAQKGGFANRRNLQYFDRFVAKIAETYGRDLTYVITLNEPNVYASFSYLTGEWPPQQKNLLTFLYVYWNLVQAHKRAYRILKRHNPKLQVGIAAQLGNIQAKRPHHAVDALVTKVMRYAWNWWFINRLRHTQDFIGFNYYFTDYYRNFRKVNPAVPVNDLGWYMEPEGLYPILLRLWAHYQKPIIITENGLADGEDCYRQWWLQETMIAIERALSEGVNVKGYFHWSLLDNFEWAYGWWPKFGLVQVDREHDMKRTIRPSAKWWAKELQKIKSNNNQP